MLFRHQFEDTISDDRLIPSGYLKKRASKALGEFIFNHIDMEVQPHRGRNN